jgi:voltage-gated potassium channel Kch
MHAMKSLFLLIVTVSQSCDAYADSSLRSAKKRDHREVMHTELIQLGTNISTQEDQFESQQVLDDPRHKRWPATTSGWTAWIFAALFVFMIAQIPISLHLFEHGLSKRPPLVSIVEGLMLFAWLILGLYLFTQVMLFQSPHFGDEKRPLTLIEAVYLFSQIFTTVGYGDITPAYTRGQVTVGFFVFLAIMLIADMVSQLSAILVQRAEEKVKQSIGHATSALGIADKNARVIGEKSDDTSPLPVIGALATFAIFCAIGTCFFHFYPGEGKTVGQGVYMSIITLTTVGFGAYTPVTQGGMVFGAFWMLFGVAALGAAVAAFTAWTVALKKKSDEELPDLKAAEEMLRNDCADGKGLVDKVGYIKYALVKWDLCKKEDIENIIQQFDSLTVDASGRVEANLILQLSARGSSARCS